MSVYSDTTDALTAGPLTQVLVHLVAQRFGKEIQR